MAGSEATPGARTLLDELLPSYQFSERHETAVRASPEEVMRAVSELTPAEIPLFRTLFAIRRLPERVTGGASGFAPGRPVLEQMLSHGFVLLGDEPERELAVGAIGQFWPLRDSFEPSEASTREEFLAFDRPDRAKAVMNFHVSPIGGAGAGVRLRTETRITVPDPHARRRFARYWRLAGPGSALIRRMWLRAIKRRAEDERASPAGSVPGRSPGETRGGA